MFQNVQVGVPIHSVMVDVLPVPLKLGVQPAEMASTNRATLALVNNYKCFIASPNTC
jgi:hypothetical protein